MPSDEKDLFTMNWMHKYPAPPKIKPKTKLTADELPPPSAYDLKNYTYRPVQPYSKYRNESERIVGKTSKVVLWLLIGGVVTLVFWEYIAMFLMAIAFLAVFYFLNPFIHF